MSNNIYITLIDDDSLILQLMGDFIKGNIKNSVINIYNRANDFLENIDKIKTDVLLLDMRMNENDLDGFDVLNYLKKENKTIKIIILTSFYKSNFTGQMFKLGCNAFLPKEIEQFQLINVIRKVLENGHYFIDDQFDIIKEQISSKSPSLSKTETDGLSAREIEILKLMSCQMTSQEIANKLFISVKTVESHKSNLLIKSGAKNSIGLIIYGFQKGLININEILIN